MHGFNREHVKSIQRDSFKDYPEMYAAVPLEICGRVSISAETYDAMSKLTNL